MCNSILLSVYSYPVYSYPTVRYLLSLFTYISLILPYVLSVHDGRKTVENEVVLLQHHDIILYSDCMWADWGGGGAEEVEEKEEEDEKNNNNTVNLFPDDGVWMEERGYIGLSVLYLGNWTRPVKSNNVTCVMETERINNTRTRSIIFYYYRPLLRTTTTRASHLYVVYLHRYITPSDQPAVNSLNRRI